jgi:hydroxymethylglutaryl-CoA reductase
MAKICTKILGVTSAQELACIMASVGLAQNFSAIRALATEGIQKGHMKLHAKNIASAAGAKPEQMDKIVQKMVQENNISLNRAKELVDQT